MRQWKASLRTLYQLCALVSLFFGLIIMTGGGGIAAMRYVSGISIIVASLGVLSLRFRPTWACCLGAIVFIVGLVALVGYIAELHTAHTVLVKVYRLAPDSALAIVLLGLFIVLFSMQRYAPKICYSLFPLSVVIFVIGLIAVTGYIVNLPSGYVWSRMNPMTLYESIAFTLLGIVTLVDSMRGLEKTIIKLQYTLPIVFLIAGLVFFLMLWQGLKNEIYRNVAQTLQLTSVQIKNLVTNELNERLHNLSSISKAWTEKNGLSKREWQHDAKFILNNVQGFQAIEWVNPQFKVMWIEPLKGNERAQGLDLGFEKNRRIALEDAKRKHIPTITSPITLVQGGRGFLVYVPIYKGSHFDGFILGVFRAKELIQSILPINLRQNYHIQLTMNNAALFSSHDKKITHMWQHDSVFKLLNSQWGLQLNPSPQLIQIFASNLPTISLILGFLFSLALSLACYYLILFRYNEHKINEQKNRLQLIYEISTLATYSISFEVLMKKCLDLICETLHWPIGHAFYFDEKTDAMLPTNTWHSTKGKNIKQFKKVTEKSNFEKGIGLPGRIWAGKQPLWIEDVYKDDTFLRAKESANLNIHAATGFPVLINNQVVAVLEFFDHNILPKDKDMLKTFGVLSEQMSRSLEKKKSESQLEMLAHYDSVTGLCNRAFFMELLEHAISRAHTTGSKLALLYIDLDNFKHINDTYGHDFGDRLLKQTASRLKNMTKEGDFIARLGGDEFVILIEDLAEYSLANRLAERMVYEFNARFVIKKKEVIVTLSVGIATYPLSGKTVAELMQNSDIAMYHAKSTGKNNYQYFSDVLNKENKRQMEVSEKLRTALSNDELHLVYQPQIDVQSNEVIGVEALIRWNSPDLGSVSSAEFIPIAEETGMIHDIGEWVMVQSCEQYLRWDEALDTKLMLSMNINVSVLQITDGYTDQLIQTIRKTGIDPHSIIIEITETTLMHDIKMAAEVLNQLYAFGIGIAIDDFGTGYSSLNYLKTLPITTLKIDQSFIRDIVVDNDAAAIVQAVIQLGKALSLHIVAEGVETKKQLEFLQQNDCDCVQGFYFSEPLLPEDVMTFVARWNKGER
ncbi:MAG: hypothetical protein COB66_06605 [Coxiella sp. (in: Bacteria)]|nr:MAG: hypothetical protein COB66_06605 [Coxiella sp. (in: g-proteobacteria)]